MRLWRLLWFGFIRMVVVVMMFFLFLSGGGGGGGSRGARGSLFLLRGGAGRGAGLYSLDFEGLAKYRK